MALRKNRKPKERIAAPTNSVSTGLAVIMSHTMPMPDTITSPASVSRLAAVTVAELDSGMTSFTSIDWIRIALRLVAGAGFEPAISRVRT